MFFALIIDFLVASDKVISGCLDRDELRASKGSLLPENNKRVRYLLDDEEQRLLSVLTGPRGHLLPLVILAIGTV